MKTISLWGLILTFIASGALAASAQESATQQQIDKLSGQIQDILDTQAQQSKRLDAIEKEISDLRDKVNAPANLPDAASRDDLKKLAEQVQEIDRKRGEDRDLILKQIAKIGSGGDTTPSPSHTHTAPPKNNDESPAPNVPDKGYYYEVKQGDTLGLIVKAYREQGVKVTSRQIKAANPTMNPDVLIPGKKIFIPDPNAK
jgi:hypothetical protein